MTIDKDGLAAAARALYALEHSCQAPEDMSPPYSPKSKIGLAIGGAEAAITAYLSALPDTGDELVAPETVAWRYAESDVEWGTTTEAAKAERLSEIVPVEPLIRLADHQAAIRANAAAAEASLASARERALEEAAVAADATEDVVFAVEAIRALKEVR